MYYIKGNYRQLSSVNFNAVVSCFRFFLSTELKKMSNIFFSAWLSDHGLLIKTNQQWKTFRMIYNRTMFGREEIFTTCQLWRHNILYLTRYLVSPAFWNHSVLFKIGQYTKRNLLTYSLSMFGKMVFVATVNYDAIIT